MKKSVLSIVFVLVLSVFALAQNYNDATLRRVIEQDRTSRDAGGKMLTLPVAEHLYRADVYMSNRQFPEAREHFQKVLDNYPTDTGAMPKVLFGTARSYMWERQYEKAVFWFDKLTKDYLSTKEGREGLAFKGASYVRLQKNAEAARTYQQYITMFPTGEKIESAYLNLIDALREQGKYDEANQWVDKTSQRFGGMAVETNALQARLRMEIFRQNWTNALAAADLLRIKNNFKGTMVSLDEVNYLKAFALERMNRKAEAIAVYSSIPDSFSSYYSGLATERLKVLSPQYVRKTASVSPASIKDFPVLYRAELLRYARTKAVDPRFVLAIMKQESSFKANAKSPAAARGLLQLVFDTALKYNKKAGFPNLVADDLYNPATNIAIGTAYMADLKTQFAGMYEAVAASYNGGEDNVARWLKRSNPKDAGIFAAEVGFAETKKYVGIVMNNYRVYRELYTEDLIRK
jgi:soluble lytic murein transglycosylase